MSIKNRVIEPKPSEPSIEYFRGMRTEIEVLDKLLGYEQSEPQSGYLKPNSILIIRGEPGAGKTTLALQILSKNIEKIKQDNKNGGDVLGKFIFFSLERKPEEVLKYTVERYGFFASEHIESNNAHLQTLDASIMEQLIQFAINKPDKGLKGIINEFKKEIKPEILEKLLEGKWEASAAGSAIILAKVLASKLSNRKLGKKITKLIQDCPYPFVLVDSLNVLVQLLQKITKNKDIPERLLLNTICDTMRETFKNSVIILTSEYHFQDVTKQSAVSESFFCDIEIALFSEPIVVPSNYEPKFESPLGSNMLSLMTPTIKSIHTQSFCRVLKSRLTPNQTRRCAYDIVADKGIEFYETYPGDGQIALFAENDRQQEVWQIFFNQDLPHIYPALRYNPFDRGSLQRTAAVQRRFRYIPQRVDLYLASFDNYWINWYAELCLKSNIYSLLQQKLNIENFLDKKELLILLNEMCAVLTQRRIFTSFQDDISVQLKGYFKIVCNHLLTISKEPWIKHAAEKLIQDDAIVHFMSFLSRVLTQSTETENTHGNPAVRPSCLQCQWYRYLIRELNNSLKQNKKIIIKSFKDVLQNNSMPEGSNIHKPPVASEEISVEAELSDVVKKITTSCLMGRPKNCQFLGTKQNQPKDPFKEFLNFNATSCNWRKRLESCIAEFILIHIVHESPKQKEMSDKGLHQKIAALVEKNRDISNSQLDELTKEIDFYLGENITNKLLGLSSTNDYVKMSEDICNKIEKNVFDVFSACHKNGDKANAKRYLDDWLEVVSKIPPQKNVAVQNFNDQMHDQLLVTLTSIFYEVAQSPAHYRLLSLVPESKLRLFGERKSEIIYELENHQLDSNRPIHHPAQLFSLKDENMYCSIPYDANIGFIVFRKDLLDPFFDELQKEERKSEYVRTIINLIQSQELALKNNVTDNYIPFEIEGGLEKQVSELVNNNISHRYPPKTWEEVIAYYIVNQQNNKTELHFLIESKTLDTYLSTMLEFIWSCGADLSIAPDYSIKSYRENLTEVFRAFYLMALMFQNKIIPYNSTLDVEDFSSRYKRDKDRNNSVKPDWMFARHWYSTLVDIVSAKKTISKSSGEQISDFMWHHDGADLGIMQIPVSFSNYIKHKGTERHISCWGDWHLAVISGTENMELGIDLINNLMNSDHICERAFANAAVPTVEAFYESYGKTPCFNLPERKDITLPDWTYNRLRENLFKHAKSRSQIYDYHHCMRELHAVLEYVHSCGKTTRRGLKKDSLDQDIQKELYEKLRKAFETIEGFIAKPFMLA